MKIKVLLTIFLLSSCSSINLPLWTKGQPKAVKLDGYKEYDETDYVDHLISFDKAYKKQNKNKIIKLTARSRKYLQKLIKNVTSANELFFDTELDASFNIIKASEPFHFSLPGRRFYMSSGLLRKYIKNEDMLYCAIIYELVRSEKNIYSKTIIIPTGTLDTNRVLSLLRLGTPDKVEIHKWGYYL